MNDAVRELALCPMRVMPTPPGMERIDLGGATALISPSQLAPLVFVDEARFDVAAAVEAARQVARDRDRERVLWWIGPDDEWVGGELAGAGIANEDTPGFEAVADALALVEPPAGKVAEDVEVAVVETWEQYRDSFGVMVASFGTPEFGDAALRDRWERYRANTEFSQFVCASVGGRVVGMGATAFSPVGLSLMAGCVDPGFRGRGIYRALVHARWQMAVDRNTPALVIQAGRMSRPVCERMGFQFIAPIRIYVDHLVR